MKTYTVAGTLKSVKGFGFFQDRLLEGSNVTAELILYGTEGTFNSYIGVLRSTIRLVSLKTKMGFNVTYLAKMILGKDMYCFNYPVSGKSVSTNIETGGFKFVFNYLIENAWDLITGSGVLSGSKTLDFSGITAKKIADDGKFDMPSAENPAPVPTPVS